MSRCRGGRLWAASNWYSGRGNVGRLWGGLVGPAGAGDAGADDCGWHRTLGLIFLLAGEVVA